MKTKRKGRPRKKQKHEPSTGQLFAGLAAIILTIGFTNYTVNEFNNVIDGVYKDSESTIMANSMKSIQKIAENKKKKEVMLSSEDIDKMVEESEDHFQTESFGDVNQDGELNNTDIDEALDILNGFSAYNENADLDMDGKVTIDDVEEIIDIVRSLK